MVECYKIILEGRKIRSETYFYLFQPCETHCQFSFCLPSCIICAFRCIRTSYAWNSLLLLYKTGTMELDLWLAIYT